AIHLRSRWAGAAALLCVILALIRISSAYGQCLSDPHQSADDIKVASIGLPYGKCFLGHPQSIRQLNFVDLNIRDLPDSPDQLAHPSDLALIAHPGRPPEPENKVAWKEAIGESLLYT